MGLLDDVLGGVPDVLKGTSPAEKSIGQGFARRGPFGGLLNALTQTPRFLQDVGKSAFDFPAPGQVRGLGQGLVDHPAQSATLAGLLGLTALAGLRGYHNYRAGELPFDERGSLALMPQGDPTPRTRQLPPS